MTTESDIITWVATQQDAMIAKPVLWHSPQAVGSAVSSAVSSIPA
jgi:hypothetical protein